MANLIKTESELFSVPGGRPRARSSAAQQKRSPLPFHSVLFEKPEDRPEQEIAEAPLQASPWLGALAGRPQPPPAGAHYTQITRPTNDVLERELILLSHKRIRQELRGTSTAGA